MIAELNRELQAVGAILNEQTSLGVYHMGEMPNEKYITYASGAVGPMDQIEGDQLTIGVFTDGYVLIANRDYAGENDFIPSSLSSLLRPRLACPTRHLS